MLILYIVVSSFSKPDCYERQTVSLKNKLNAFSILLHIFKIDMQRKPHAKIGQPCLSLRKMC
jgi:hypothetical protein